MGDRRFAGPRFVRGRLAGDRVALVLPTAPPFVENEMARAWKKGLRRLSGRCLCCGAHGLSLAITAWRGEVSHTLLFDTGPDVAVLRIRRRNAEW